MLHSFRYLETDTKFIGGQWAPAASGKPQVIRHPARGEVVGRVERLLRDRVAPMRAEPGRRRYDLYRNHGAGPMFTLFEIHDDFAAVEHYRSTEHDKHYRGNIEQHLDVPIEARLYDGVDVIREEA